jgi:hypothetical protein
LLSGCLPLVLLFAARLGLLLLQCCPQQLVPLLWCLAAQAFAQLLPPGAAQPGVWLAQQ